MDPERPTMRVPPPPWGPGTGLAILYGFFVQVRSMLTGKPLPTPPEPEPVPKMWAWGPGYGANDKPVEPPSMDVSTVLFLPGLIVVGMITAAIANSMEASGRVTLLVAIAVPIGVALAALGVGAVYRRWWRARSKTKSA